MSATWISFSLVILLFFMRKPIFFNLLSEEKSWQLIHPIPKHPWEEIYAYSAFIDQRVQPPVTRVVAVSYVPEDKCKRGYKDNYNFLNIVLKCLLWVQQWRAVLNRSANYLSLFYENGRPLPFIVARSVTKKCPTLFKL